MSADHDVADPRRRHAPLGQVGPQLRRVRRDGRTRRPGRRRASTGTTSSSCPAPTPCATAIPATCRRRRSRRRSAGPARRWRRRYAACASGATARRTRPGRRSSPACATSPSWSAPTPRPRASSHPTRGDRRDDPDWLRFRLLGATNPTYFGAATPAGAWTSTARPRTTSPRSRSRTAATALHQPERPLPQGVHRGRRLGSPDGGRPAAPARDLRHLRRRRGGRRARAWTTRSAHGARRPGAGGGHLDGDARPIPNTVIELPNFATDSAAAVPRRPSSRSSDSIAARRLRGGRRRARRPRRRRGVRPLVRPRARLVREHRALRARARPRSCCATATPTIGGRIPVNPSGGLALLRRGRPRAGHRPGVRAHLAAAGPGRRPPGRGRPRRPHRQPGPVRPRLVGHRHPLTSRHDRTGGRGGTPGSRSGHRFGFDAPADVVPSASS